MHIAYFDLFSGASGDMILGALVDAGLDPADLRRELRKFPLAGYSIEVSRVKRGAIAAAKVDVVVRGNAKSEIRNPKSARAHAPVRGIDHDHEHESWHGHGHGPAGGVDHDHETETWHGHHDKPETGNRKPETAHGHGTTLKTILGQIARSGLPPRVKRDASAVFTRLGKAEGKVHGVPPMTVHFHEVGAVDSIVDIVGACAGLHLLGIDAVYASPFPVTRGAVDCRHGTIPVPGPATAELLRGFPVTSVDVERELVTPTGAAILTTLAAKVGTFPDMTPAATGYGAGTADPRERPNVLRVWIGETAEERPGERVWVLETNLDDTPGVLVGYVSERLFGAGALDVYTVPVQMKKGRPGVLLGVLAPEAKVRALEDILFRETTTLGVRRHPVERTTLARETTAVSTKYGRIRVKVGRDGGEILSVSPEYEDCRKVAEAKRLPLKRVIKLAAAAYRHLHAPES